MSEQALKLRVPASVWYSPGEENAFFQWLYSLRGYVSCKGFGQMLEIVFDLNNIEKDTACDLVAMFRRYFPDEIRQLDQIKISKIGDWFSSPDTYWHSKIFGD
jgi:hypothetical protein